MPVVLLLLALAAAAGCELKEVTVAPGERRVVVQAVVSRKQGEQFVVVEYSLVGDTSAHALFGEQVPPGTARIPIAGAVVTLEHLSLGLCAGRVDTLPARPAPGQSTVPSGVYQGAVCGVQPGERLRLRVRTPEGEEVTGETTVPGAERRRVEAGGRGLQFPLETLEMNRQRDTLRIGISATHGHALQVEVRRAENHDELAVFLFLDTLGVALPGNLVNPFDDDSGRTTFRAGRYYLLTVAVTDSNYFDFVRSVTDPITGRGFINRLQGGVGVFGSLEAESYLLRIVAPLKDPREGIYRVTGLVGTMPVDALLELYVDDLAAERFSAFLVGDWDDGPVDQSGDGYFGVGPLSTPGPNAFLYTFNRVLTSPPRLRIHSLVGTRSADGTPFPVDLTVRDSRGATRSRASLAAQQVSGTGLP